MLMRLILCTSCTFAAQFPAVSEVSTEVFTGSSTVSVTAGNVAIEDFEKNKFSGFVEESVRRYFDLSKATKIVFRITSSNSIQDIEVVGPSRCLAKTITRNGWQKLRFEFSYSIDDAYLASTSRVRYQISVRVISGEVADFQLDSEPPSNRFKQVTPSELTDLATRFAGFIRQEMSRECFQPYRLNFCADAHRKECQ